MLGLIGWFFIICLVTLPSIASVYYANVLFYPQLLLQRVIRINKNALLLFGLFILIYFLSICNYVFVLGGVLKSRFIVSLFFTFQYVILCIKPQIDTRKFEKIFITISLVYSIAIIGMFFVKRIYASPMLFFIHNRMWGEDIFYGWPNTTGLPLLFALFFLFKKSERLLSEWFYKSILMIAIVLTTSRTVLLGTVVIVVFYYLYPRKGITKLFLQERLFFFLLALIIIAFIAARINVDDLIKRLLYTADRVDIANVVQEVVQGSPLFGYGGLSLDTAAEMASVNTTFTHTHNFVFELLVRYGICGTVLFFGLLIATYRRINSIDNRMMFILMWFLALLQIYVRDFCFLFLVVYLGSDEKEMIPVARDRAI